MLGVLKTSAGILSGETYLKLVRLIFSFLKLQKLYISLLEIDPEVI
jgi:hypothetical protein